MASKIIISGSIHGNFPAVFEKISKLHAKNKFSLAILLGDLFADPAKTSPEDEANVNALLTGEISIPLPTYFTLGRHPLPTQITEKLGESEDELCPNLYFLDKRSTTKTSEGIRIVNLAGALDLSTTIGPSKGRFLPFHTQNDARSLYGSNTADILITSHWPTSIRSGSKVTITESKNPHPHAEQQYVADLCSVLKPRYHFTTSDEFFYEREPFVHPSDQSQPGIAFITRFINLAAFGTSSQQKWLYAFSIDPTAVPPATIPTGTTPSPLTYSKKRPLPDQEQYYSRFANPSHKPHQFRSNKRARAPPTPQDCFFCLSNPELATHLITSIATESYLTTAKGPLSTSATFPSLNCPAHILIIPLAHSPTLPAIPDQESRDSTPAEMHRYRRALQDYLSSHHTSGQEEQSLGAVTWELSRASGVHVHWQFLPVPTTLVAKGLVEAAFKVEAENEKYPPFQPTASSDEDGDHFRVWIWKPSTTEQEEEGRQERALTLPIPADSRFDAQFGRRVMAKLLGLEKRMDWRDCVEGIDEELSHAHRFKDGFKRWDFSLESEA